MKVYYQCKKQNIIILYLLFDANKNSYSFLFNININALSDTLLNISEYSANKMWILIVKQIIK